MDYLIKNGRIADKNGCYEADLIIKNGKITYIGDGLDATGLEVIDAVLDDELSSAHFHFKGFHDGFLQFIRSIIVYFPLISFDIMDENPLFR